MKIAKTKNQDLIEELAELEHKQWCEWTKYMLKNLDEKNFDRWKKQIATEYNLLPEIQKWSDRRWAKKVLSIIRKYM